MPTPFSAEEMQARRVAIAKRLNELGLDGLLMFKQESMYYLTGYDSFGFSMFQCLVIDSDGNTALLTRLPDLRQARYTSDIEDIRLWHDVEGVVGVDHELRAVALTRLGDRRQSGHDASGTEQNRRDQHGGLVRVGYHGEEYS